MRLTRRHLIIAFIVALLGAGAAFAQLPDSVPLLPDQPWEAPSFTTPDGAATYELQQAEGDGAPVAQVTVTEVPTDRWAIGFAWDTIAPIAMDDALVLTFEARALGDGDPPGSINLAFRRVSKPYHHALSDTINLANEWREFQIPFSPTVAMDAGGGTLRLNLGTQQQTVEIRNLSIANYGGDISYLALCRLLDIDPGAAGNRPVGQHLTPDLLWEMRVFDDLPAPDPDFDPAGDWEQTWRIWTCYGYVARSNQNLGVLHIARTAGDPIMLQVEQRQLNTEGGEHVQTATIACAPDAIATPLRWDYASSFIAPDGEERADLRVERTVDTPPEGPVAAHWGLFEAVQRLPFEEGVEQSFDVLDSLTARKSGHTLRYDGAHDVRFGTDTRTLHRFVQVGHGALPFEYWLDDDHHLVLVISEYRVYVLDPDAGETLTGAQENQQSRYERLKERYEPDTEDDDGE